MGRRRSAFLNQENRESPSAVKPKEPPLDSKPKAKPTSSRKSTKKAPKVTAVEEDEIEEEEGASDLEESTGAVGERNGIVLHFADFLLFQYSVDIVAFREVVIKHHCNHMELHWVFVVCRVYCVFEMMRMARHFSKKCF